MGILTRLRETQGAPVNDPQAVEELRAIRGGTEVSRRTQNEINDALGQVATPEGLVKPDDSLAIHSGEHPIVVLDGEKSTEVESADSVSNPEE